MARMTAHKSPVAYTFVVIGTVDRVICINWNLLSLALVSAPSAFIVSACGSC